MKNEFDFDKKRGVGIFAFIATVLIAAIVSSFATYIAVTSLNDGKVSLTADEKETKVETVSVYSTDFSKVYKDNCDSIVVISTFVTYNGELTKYAQNSGFFITEDGYILTNSHCVEEIEKATVKLYDGTELDAEIVGSDARTEVAVLKVKGEGKFKKVTFGDSDKLTVGEYAIAIGCPLGYEYSMNVGIISGIQRKVVSNNYCYKMIQTDATINSGNSGGPLFNQNGEVIGITTMKSVGSVTSATVEGMGFAVPINIAVNIAEQFINDGKVTRALMQATVANSADGSGVYIAELVKDGAAEVAGIMVNDIIKEFDGKTVTYVSDLMEYIDYCVPGQTVKITVSRGGENITFDVVLGSS